MDNRNREYAVPSKNESFFYHSSNITGTFTMPREHFHDFYEIYFLVSGKRKYLINDQVYDISPGNIVIIDKYSLYKTIQYENSPHQRILINFPAKFMYDFMLFSTELNILEIFNKDIHILNPDEKDQEFIQILLDKIKALYVKKESGHLYSIRAHLLVILLYIKGYLDKAYESSKKEKSCNDNKLNQILNFISKNYYRSLNLSEIGSKFHYSESYISRLFVKTINMTFIEYLNQTRIKNACVLLRETNLKVLEVAGKTGFNNSTHFGRVFKKITGVHPLKYRKKSGHQQSKS
jgi:AraC-like DNA-binding protein